MIQQVGAGGQGCLATKEASSPSNDSSSARTVVAFGSSRSRVSRAVTRVVPGATGRTIVWEYESPGQFPGALCFLVCLRAQCQRTSAMLAVILVAKVGRRRHIGGYANTAICRDNTRPVFDPTDRRGAAADRADAQTRIGQPSFATALFVTQGPGRSAEAFG